MVVALGQKKEMIGNGMTSEGQIFSQQEMSVAIRKMKENKAADERGVVAELEGCRGIWGGVVPFDYWQLHSPEWTVTLATTHLLNPLVSGSTCHTLVNHFS